MSEATEKGLDQILLMYGYVDNGNKDGGEVDKTDDLRERIERFAEAYHIERNRENGRRYDGTRFYSPTYGTCCQKIKTAHAVIDDVKNTILRTSAERAKQIDDFLDGMRLPIECPKTNDRCNEGCDTFESKCHPKTPTS